MCLACNGSGHAQPANPAPALPEGGPEAPPENSATLRSFTTAEALADFTAAWLNEDRCRQWVIDQLHDFAARCPSCGLALDDDASFRAGKRCHCGRCGRWFTATTGTFLEGAHLDFRQVYLLAVLIELKLSPRQIAYFVGVSADTVRLWIKRFRAFEGE
ncbi:hypothetical protein KJ039_07160 [bacterium]|nr:hypothetical protein [bacterium]